MAWASASRASSTAALARLIDDQPGGEQLQRAGARLSGKVCLSVTRVPMEYLSLFEAITEGRLSHFKQRA